MDTETFNRLVSRTRLRPASVRMARAILIEGVGSSEAGRREGLTHVRAHDAAARVLRELRIEGGYPPGWAPLTVVVPWDVRQQIRDLAESAELAAGLRIDRPRRSSKLAGSD